MPFAGFAFCPDAAIRGIPRELARTLVDTIARSRGSSCERAQVGRTTEKECGYSPPDQSNHVTTFGRPSYATASRRDECRGDRGRARGCARIEPRVAPRYRGASTDRVAPDGGVCTCVAFDVSERRFVPAEIGRRCADVSGRIADRVQRPEQRSPGPAVLTGVDSRPRERQGGPSWIG